MKNQLQCRPFQPSDQPRVKQLILDGLVEHWGFLDPTLNPDLNNIAQTYARGDFVVACIDGEIVGTGAIIPEGKNGRVVRMSIKKEKRRQGYATIILNHLIDIAKEKGYEHVVLETTSTWQEVIQFYLRNGFIITHHADGDTHFVLSLCQ